MPGKTPGIPRKGSTKAPAADGGAPGAEPAPADRYIADQLKAVYDAVAAEPLPDRLLQLLDRLDEEAKK
jgi:Anti-sigma factor NepR